MDGMITGEGEGTAAMEGDIYMRGYGRDDNWGGGRNSSYGRYNIYI